MPSRSLSRRVIRLVAAARKTSATLHQIKQTLDAYLTDGTAPERVVASISLSLTHSDLNELDTAVAAFERAV